MKSLTDFSAQIDILTKNQESSGFTVKSGLEELIALSRNLMGSVERNVEGNADLARLVKEIEKVAGESAEESIRLNQLLAREGE